MKSDLLFKLDTEVKKLRLVKREEDLDLQDVFEYSGEQLQRPIVSKEFLLLLCPNYKKEIEKYFNSNLVHGKNSEHKNVAIEKDSKQKKLFEIVSLID